MHFRWQRFSVGPISLLMTILVGCGSGSEDASVVSGGVGGAAGSPTAQAGTAGNAQAGAGTSGSAGAGGTSSTGGIGGMSGMVGSIEFPMQPDCDYPAIACNGVCLHTGQSTGNCAYVLNASVGAMVADQGALYFAADVPLGSIPDSGVYRFDGTTGALTLLDGESRASDTAAMALADDTLVYIIRDPLASVGALRAVPTAGGQPITLVDNLRDVRSMVVTQGRAYFAAKLTAGALNPQVHSVPLTGGDVATGSFGAAAGLQANQNLLAIQFGIDSLETAPLPDISQPREVVQKLQLPSASSQPFRKWWIDEDYLYWQRDTIYYRLTLSSTSATEDMGEVVQMLPPPLQARPDIKGGEVFLTATNETPTTVGDTAGLYVMPIAGGEPTRLAVVGSRAITWIAPDAGHVFLSTPSAILRVDR